MAEIGFFPPPNYAPGHHLTFEEPQHSEWIIINRISQCNSQASESDAQAGIDCSYAVVTFSVRNYRDGREAYMRVYLQVPHREPSSFQLSNELSKLLLAAIVRSRLSKPSTKRDRQSHPLSSQSNMVSRTNRGLSPGATSFISSSYVSLEPALLTTEFCLPGDPSLTHSSKNSMKSSAMKSECGSIRSIQN